MVKERNLMKACLLIIDMQNDFLQSSSPLYVRGGPDIIPVVKKILEFFRSKSLPVVFVVRAHRGSGVDIDKPRLSIFRSSKGLLVEGTEGTNIVKELQPISSELVVVKKRFSAFFHTELDLLLRRIGVDLIVICGVQTPNCIRATAVDGLSYDYDVVVLSDCTASSREDVQLSNLYDMKNMGIRVMASDELITYLSEVSGQE